MAERKSYLVPKKFRRKPRNAGWQNDRQCRGDQNGPACGLMVSQHTGECCVLCSRAIEHHLPGEFEAEVEAHARMARAREAAGTLTYERLPGRDAEKPEPVVTGGLDEIDRLCLDLADG